MLLEKISAPKKLPLAEIALIKEFTSSPIKPAFADIALTGEAKLEPKSQEYEDNPKNSENTWIPSFVPCMKSPSFPPIAQIDVLFE